MQKKYTSFFEPRKFRIVYVPTIEGGKYSALILTVNRTFLRLLTPRNIGAVGVLSFVFLSKLILPIIVILIIFIVLGLNKELAKKIHLLIPFIVYEKMSEIEVRHFLKTNKQFDTDYKEKNLSKISQPGVIPDDPKDHEITYHEDDLIAVKNKKDTIDSYTQVTTKDTKPKSIFDDYESVMDKFKK